MKNHIQIKRDEEEICPKTGNKHDYWTTEQNVTVCTNCEKVSAYGSKFTEGDFR